MGILLAGRAGHAAFLLLLVLFLAGCTTVARDMESAPQKIFPIAEMAKELPPYRIQVGDVLEIKMLLNPELQEEIIVRPDGMISTAVAYDVWAFGLTPMELQNVLNERYKAHLSDPRVSVVVRTFAPTRIYVLGEVLNPGEYLSVGPNLTLLQALARAGGIKNSALTDKIVILRRGSGNDAKAYAANYGEAVSGRDPASDVRLAAYDVVYVPRTGVAEVFAVYEQYVQQFLRPGFNVGYSLNR